MLRVLAALLWLGLGLAQPVYAQTAAPTAPPAESVSLLERFNQAMFRANTYVGGKLVEGAKQLGMGGEDGSITQVGARVLFNFVNEPVSVVSHAVAGEFGRAWDHVKRFAINTTLGYGGAIDRAKAWGLEPSVADFGLSLCGYDVPAGPYVVVPVLGPRTLRDAVSDIVLSNLVIVGMLAPFAGGALSWEAIALIALIDELAVLGVARQMDPVAAAIGSKSYEETKSIYLADRSRRCAAMAAPHDAKPQPSALAAR